MKTKYPDITVQLTGKDKNVFNLIGVVGKELRRNNIPPSTINNFRKEIMECRSYNDTLVCIMKWVNVS